MLDKLETYYNYLIEQNKLYNLTSIVLKEEVYIKHFEDSLSLENIFDLKENLKICDVGSGAGFPGLVLALKYPNQNITIIEPTLKKVNFMKNVCLLLDIKNVTFYNARVEDLKHLEESFDIVLARAVSSLNVLVELLVKLVRVNGYIVGYKGDKASEEINNAQNALKLLDLEIEEVYEYNLSKNYGKRNLIKIKKLKKTKSIYPRMYKDIKKRPL